MDELHEDVRPIVRQFLVVGVFGYVIGGLLFVGGFFAPGLISGARVPGWVLGLVGIFLIGIGWLASFYGPKWYRRASWVVQMTSPTTMHLTIRIVLDEPNPRSKSRSLFAQLRPSDAAPATAPAESISVQWPNWDVSTLPPGPVDVFQDPVPGGPIIIRTSRGWLWPSPGSGFKRPSETHRH